MAFLFGFCVCWHQPAEESEIDENDLAFQSMTAKFVLYSFPAEKIIPTGGGVPRIFYYIIIKLYGF